MTEIKKVNETSLVSLNDGLANERSFILSPLVFPWGNGKWKMFCKCQKHDKEWILLVS